MSAPACHTDKTEEYSLQASTCKSYRKAQKSILCKPAPALHVIQKNTEEYSLQASTCMSDKKQKSILCKSAPACHTDRRVFSASQHLQEIQRVGKPAPAKTRVFSASQHLHVIQTKNRRVFSASQHLHVIQKSTEEYSLQASTCMSYRKAQKSILCKPAPACHTEKHRRVFSASQHLHVIQNSTEEYSLQASTCMSYRKTQYSLQASTCMSYRQSRKKEVSASQRLHIEGFRP